MLALALVSVCILFLAATPAWAAGSFTTSQLTTDSLDDVDPQVSGDRVVWCCRAGSDSEIFTWTPTGGAVRLTDNEYDDRSPQVSGDRVVWYGFDGSTWRIYTWTPGGGTVKLTTNSQADWDPQVSGDRIVWCGDDGTDYEIFTWTPVGGVVRLTKSDYDDSFPQVSGDRVVWYGYDGTDYEIFTWTPVEGTVRLTNNGYDDEHPQVSGDRVVWFGYDGTDYEIFTWTLAAGTVRLTTNGQNESLPQVSGDRVVWYGYDGTDWEIFTATATYTLSTSVPGGGGTITREPDQSSFETGSSVILTAVPGEGFLFSGWGEDVTGTTNPLTVVMEADKTVTAIFTEEPLADFPDVPSSHPYYTAIMDLADRGIINGYANGYFGPDDLVRRQQFAKMIVGARDYRVSEADVCYFTDVEKSDATTLYPDNYVAVCAAHGITLGKTATTFNPYNFITRYQVISMVVRACEEREPSLLQDPPSGWTGHAGWGGDPTHGANALRAEYNDLLYGLDLAVLDPYGNMTRGEVAQVLYNLIGIVENMTWIDEIVPIR